MAVAAQRTRRRQQREETRAQIMRAATDFLLERSYRELSVDALMTRTGHTRTVFYRHFEDVPSLMLTLIAEVGSELFDISTEWMSIEQTSPEEARRQLAQFVGFYARNGRLVRAVAEAAHHDESVNEAYTSVIERFVSLTAEAMQRRVDRGEVEALDAPEIARALVWMLNGYLLDRFGNDDTADEERVLQSAWTVWSRTIFPGQA